MQHIMAFYLTFIVLLCYDCDHNKIKWIPGLIHDILYVTVLRNKHAVRPGVKIEIE